MDTDRAGGTPLWSLSETARWLGVPEATVHAWVYKGTAPRSFKVGRHRKFRPEDVAAWLEAQADDREPVR